jgi:hypothetical protein
MSTEIGVVIQAPFAKLHITDLDVSDHAIMRARQLAALLLLMQPDEGPDSILWLAQQMADELVIAVKGMMGAKA